MFPKALFFITITLLYSQASAWLPLRDNGIIRGVNLGGLFIVEPWMMGAEWASMGCGGQASEFDCVMNYPGGQNAADAAFQRHWGSWITAADFSEMSSYGINTVRIPIGYWMKEDLKYDSEHFPRGGWRYLENVVGYAKQYGISVLLDLHGAPGAQVKKQPFTGQYAPTEGFYVDWQYARAYEFLKHLVNETYSNPAFSTVFALELLNEPVGGQPTLCSSFYPNAYKTIRDMEASFNIPPQKRLHVSMMNNAWGSGDPLSAGGYSDIVLDDHHYVKWSGISATKGEYMRHSCTNLRSNPADQGHALVVGEWSLSTDTNTENAPEFTINDPNNVKWYKDWFAAQVMSYEMSGKGWIFWSWKTQLGNDWRWGYQAAVKAGIIPMKLEGVRDRGAQVCTSYRKMKRAADNTRTEGSSRRRTRKRRSARLSRRLAHQARAHS